MGFMDELTSLAGQVESGSAPSGAVGGIMEALQNHPGGIQGVMDSFKNNGMADHASELASGAASSTTPEQVQQGLAGTGLIESAAARAGVSPQVAAMAMSAVLPLVLQHFQQSGGTTQPSAMSSIASSVLSRFL